MSAGEIILYLLLTLYLSYCCVICGGMCYYECKPINRCVNHWANKYFNNYIKLNNDEISIEITNRRLETIDEVDESDDELDREHEIKKMEEGL